MTFAVGTRVRVKDNPYWWEDGSKYYFIDYPTWGVGIGLNGIVKKEPTYGKDNCPGDTLVDFSGKEYWVATECLEAVEETTDKPAESLEEYKNKVRDRIIKEAKDRGWCAEVDTFLESIDLEPRTKQYRVSVDYYVTAPDSDEAEALVDNIIAPSVNNIDAVVEYDINGSYIVVPNNYRIG